MVRRVGLVGRVVAVLLVAGVLAAAGCGGAPDSDPADPAAPADPPATADPDNGDGDGSDGEPPGEPLGPAVDAGPVAVYYVGEEQVVTEDGASQQRLRLYREFHSIHVGDGSLEARLHASVAQLFTPGSALDPDFTSLWPESAVLFSVTVSDGTASLDILNAATNPGVGAEGSGMALQQLIWTVTAEPAVDRVELLFDGEPVSELWGHVSVPQPAQRAAAIDTVALLWLISPQHGQTVPGTFEVHIYGAPFEATAQLRVREGATVVHEQFVTLGGSGFPEFFGEAKVDLTLDPGTYTLEVYEESAVDGTEIRLDDKVITVG